MCVCWICSNVVKSQESKLMVRYNSLVGCCLIGVCISFYYQMLLCYCILNCSHCTGGSTSCTQTACNSQVGVFSATLPPEALEITRKFMNKPVSLVLVACTVVHGSMIAVVTCCASEHQCCASTILGLVNLHAHQRSEVSPFEVRLKRLALGQQLQQASINLCVAVYRCAFL